MTKRSMYRVLMSYLSGCPVARQERELPSGEKVQVCVFSPHSLRATTATLLLDTSVPIESVRDLLDHRNRAAHRQVVVETPQLVETVVLPLVTLWLLIWLVCPGWVSVKLRRGVPYEVRRLMAS